MIYGFYLKTISEYDNAVALVEQARDTGAGNERRALATEWGCRVPTNPRP